MNRRSFLKILVFAGASILVPITWTIKKARKAMTGKNMRVFVNGKEIKVCNNCTYQVQLRPIEVING